MHDINRIASDQDKQLTSYTKTIFMKHWFMLIVSKNVSD